MIQSEVPRVRVRVHFRVRVRFLQKTRVSRVLAGPWKLYRKIRLSTGTQVTKRVAKNLTCIFLIYFGPREDCLGDGGGSHGIGEALKNNDSMNEAMKAVRRPWRKSSRSPFQSAMPMIPFKIVFEGM